MPVVRGADSFSGLRHHRVSVRGADRANGWFCSIREVGGVPRTGCGKPSVRGAESRTQSECPRGGQGKWLVLLNPPGRRGAEDMVWHAGCPRGGKQNAVRVSAGRTGQMVGSAQSARWEGCRGQGVASRVSAGRKAERSPSVRGADRVNGWFCSIRQVGGVPRTGCGKPSVRGAESANGGWQRSFK